MALPRDSKCHYTTFMQVSRFFDFQKVKFGYLRVQTGPTG